MSHVFTVAPHQVDVWRDTLLPHLKRFERETGRTSAETLLEQAKRSERQIWGLHDGIRVQGVVVTEIYPTTRGDVCWIWVAVGGAEKDDIVRVYTHIEEWARVLGCKTIGICGRKGWERVLPGFKQTAVVIEKELGNAGKH